MRRMALATLFVLVGCDMGNNMEGNWEGECDILYSGYQYRYDLDIDIDQDDGGDLSGSGELSVYGYKLDGDIDGTRNGTDVDMTFEIVNSGYFVDIEMDGIKDGDSIEGDCTIKVYGYAMSGDLELDR